LRTPGIAANLSRDAGGAGLPFANQAADNQKRNAHH
jgi:hypothetical protein